MDLFLIYGPPASGKLTVGRELSRRTGYRLFHNHLTVDLLLSVFEFGSPGFVELREQIWLSVFEHASREGFPGLIFTFAHESSVRRQFFDQLGALIARQGDRRLCIELTCPVPILRDRLSAPSRREFGKLMSVEKYDQLSLEGVFDEIVDLRPDLSIDTAVVEPEAAVRRILDVVRQAPR